MKGMYDVSSSMVIKLASASFWDNQFLYLCVLKNTFRLFNFIYLRYFWTSQSTLASGLHMTIKSTLNFLFPKHRWLLQPVVASGNARAELHEWKLFRSLLRWACQDLVGDKSRDKWHGQQAVSRDVSYELTLMTARGRLGVSDNSVANLASTRWNFQSKQITRKWIIQSVFSICSNREYTIFIGIYFADVYSVGPK